MTTYSIAEARDRFAALIRQVERKRQAVQVTRRGTPVAVILSQEEYDRLLNSQMEHNFWPAYHEWRRAWEPELWADDDTFGDVRDQSPGREIAL
jgi:prevent-host-death family protein